MRVRIVNRLLRELEQMENVLALWEAGSRATGRADDMSDLDLQVLVTDGTVSETVQRLEAVLNELGPVNLRYEVPQPSWHGAWQAFYRLDGVSPLLMVDLVIIEEKNPNRFLEPEIHGRPVVYLDRQGVITQAPTDSAAFAERLRKRLPQLEVPAELFHPFVEKELIRGRAVDGLSFYQGLVLTRLVEALRMRYAPWRYNFGQRYLQYDLPPAIYEQVRELAYVASPDELPAKVQRAMALLRQTLGELKELDLQKLLEQTR